MPAANRFFSDEKIKAFYTVKKKGLTPNRLLRQITFVVIIPNSKRKHAIQFCRHWLP
jgi:hypothetical protein